MIIAFRTVRVWLKRDSGQYWPSVCQYMSAGATAMYYHVESRRLFVGLENGSIDVSVKLHCTINSGICRRSDNIIVNASVFGLSLPAM